jgi:hypothetical protein
VNWFKKKWRIWRRRCPYCNKSMNRGFVGAFLNPAFGCPDKHYAEEVVAYAGVIVYDVGFPKPPPPDPRCTCDNEQGCDIHDAKVIELKVESEARKIRG